MKLLDANIVMYIDSDVILETTRLMHKYPKLVARDAIHAAVAITYDLEGIISVDKVFEGIKGLKRFEP
ncbi:MAG: PIN domain-containing protein [Candidatus Brocadiaceae bacterium]|nr:PIN domain-containing protein [Candidatus Brocadiaceae bacterium]